MADFTENFLRGIQVGQAGLQHQQALAESKLHQQILKHQIDNLKIDDQIRANTLARAQAELLEGRPQADIPSETVPQPQTIPATQGIPGLVQGLLMSKVGLPQGPTADGTPTLPAESTPTATPAADATPTQVGPLAQGDRFTTTTRRSLPITIPGISGNGYNIPSVDVRPRSLEDLMADKARAKNLDDYTLSGDQVRFQGGTNTPIARGLSRFRNYNRATLTYMGEQGDEAAASAAGDLTPFHAAAQKNPTPAWVDREDGTGGDLRYVRWSPQTGFTTPDGIVLDAARVHPPGAAKAAKSTDLSPNQTMARYNAFLKNWAQRYPKPTDKDIQRARAARQPPPTAPPPPPEFKKWEVMSDAEQADVLANPQNRIDDATMAQRRAKKNLPARSAGTTTVPNDITQALQGKDPGIYQMDDGSIWHLMADGSVVAGQ